MGSHSTVPQPVPAALIAERTAGWHAFTRFIVANCVTIAGILILMLIFLRIL
jgi:hypothetical protein